MDETTKKALAGIAGGAMAVEGAVAPLAGEEQKDAPQPPHTHQEDRAPVNRPVVAAEDTGTSGVLSAAINQGVMLVHDPTLTAFKLQDFPAPKVVTPEPEDNDDD